MRKFFIYLILVTYLNMALVPHLGEVDVFVAGTTHQVDEINSLYEQIMVSLGYDSTAEDEDGDSGTEDDSTTNSSKILQYCALTQYQSTLKFFFVINEKKFNHFVFEKFNLSSIDFGIESPPPEV
jgi:hypothetical protein